MIKFFNSFFAAQHEQRDSLQTARARLLTALSGGIAFLALIFGLFLLIAALLDLPLQSGIASRAAWLAPTLIAWTGGTLWLLRRGNLAGATLSSGMLLWGMALASLVADGLTASAALTVPLALLYNGLIYGPKGTLVGVILAWTLLLLAAYLQSEGQTQAEALPLGKLMSEAGSGAGMLTLAALLLGLFAWNLQRALVRINRIMTQTRATAEVGQSFAQVLNMDELLTRAVQTIRDRFAFFHVQVFLVDESREYANLVASTGQIGSTLLAQGYRIPLSLRTVVGDVISTGQIRYIPDMSAMSYRRPELLADTRTELALPLTVGSTLFGALDIFSLRPDALSSEDIETMRVLANQLSQAIQNARLFEAQQQGLLQNRRLFLESETNLREIQRLNRQLTGQSWQEYMLERGADYLSVQLVGQDMRPVSGEWTPAMQQALARQRLVTHEDDDEQVMAVPITIRGQSIGVIEVRISGEQAQANVRNVLQAIAERMAFSLENARLFEQARMAAEREQQINLITARLQGLTSLEDVLTTAIDTLGQALGADQGMVRLVTLDAPASAVRPPGDNGSPGPVSSLDPRRQTNPGRAPFGGQD